MKQTLPNQPAEDRSKSQRDPLFPLPASLELPLTLEEAVNNFERSLILRALEKTGGIQTQAARLLGTTRRILRYRMDKLDIAVTTRKQK